MEENVRLMEAMIVALISAFGAIAVALINKGRKDLKASREEIHQTRLENTRDHGVVRDALGRIESKIDTHINDHAVGKFDERTQ